MAYKWDKDGNLVGDGLPSGMKFDLAAYQAAVKQIQEKNPSNVTEAMYPTMRPKLADVVTGFKYDKTKNQVMAFVPFGEQNSGPTNTIQAYLNKNKPPASPWDKLYNGNIAQMAAGPQGSWIPVSGVDLDPSTLSGTADERISFREDGGAPLAAFGDPNREVGYMRLRQVPQQAEKLADNINLRSNTQRSGPVNPTKARI